MSAIDHLRANKGLYNLAEIEKRLGIQKGKLHSVITGRKYYHLSLHEEQILSKLIESLNFNKNEK